jgi:hypothetical protein
MATTRGRAGASVAHVVAKVSACRGQLASRPQRCRRNSGARPRSLARLPRAAARRRDELETALEEARRAFVEAGRALAEIRDQRLYRDTHETFEDYLQDRWGFSRPQGYRLIDAAAVADAVSPIGDVANEAQARELVPVLRTGGPEAVRAVIESLGDEPLTAAKLKAARERHDGPPAPPSRRRSTPGLSWRITKEVSGTRFLEPVAQGGPELRVSINPVEDLRVWVRRVAGQQTGTSGSQDGELLDLPGANRQLIEAVKLGRWEQPEVRDYACLLARAMLADGARPPRLRKEAPEDGQPQTGAK